MSFEVLAQAKFRFTYPVARGEESNAVQAIDDAIEDLEAQVAQLQNIRKLITDNCDHPSVMSINPDSPSYCDVCGTSFPRKNTPDVVRHQC